MKQRKGSHTAIRRALLASMILLGLAYSAEAEVHMIGIYRGKEPTSPEYQAAVREFTRRCSGEDSGFLPECEGGLRAINQRFPYRAKVHVTRVGSPITLILSGYDSTLWRVTVAKGVKLEKIILTGYHSQRFAGDFTARKANRVFSWYGNDRAFPPLYVHEDDRETPVAMASRNEHRQLTCHEPKEGGRLPRHRSILQEALDALATRGIVPDSIQGQGSRQQDEFLVGRQTKGITLPKGRRSYLCYRNADGSLVPGDR